MKREAVDYTMPKFRYYWKLKWSIIRSGLVGCLIGIFPGAGGTIASFLAYDVEKRVSKHPEEFGHGAPAGVVAAEASNSGSVGGAMVPLLALGIPGSSTAAVLIGGIAIAIALIAYGTIAKGIEHDALWSGAFSGLLNASVETLSEYFNDKNINREFAFQKGK